MNYIDTYSETIVDGEGIRLAIYFAGCPHRCKGCHNPESRDPTIGKKFTDEVLDQLITEINSNPLLDGITLSGGDPFYNPKEMLPIVKRLKKETGQSIWCYSGYTYEQILKDSSMAAILEYIDVLVDGPFIQNLFSPELEFRGSSNQRIIELHK